LKISYFIVPLTLITCILTGCTSLTPPTSQSDNSAAAPAPEVADTESSTPIPYKEKLPYVDLSEEIFFKVITAEIAFQRNDFPAAFSTMAAVAQQTRDPRLSKRALEMALIAKQQNQAFFAARQWYEFAPDSEEALQYYLGFLILNNNWNEVKSLLAQHLDSATPKERGYLILQSERLIMRSTNKESAFALLDELFHPYQEYLESHLALAQAAYASKNNIRAMVEARTSLRIKPDSQLAALTLAQVSPSPDDALKSLSDFLSGYPEATEVRRAYADMLIEQKQYEPARAQLELLLKSKPNDAGLFYTLGVLSLQLNDVADAETNLIAFVHALDSSGEQRDPTTAYLYLSQIADDRKDGVAAIEWLNKIQSYDGKNAAWFNAQLRRAILISRYQSLDQARDALHQLHATPEEQIQVAQLDSELLRNAGRDNDALTLLQEAIKVHPDSPELLYDYAMLSEKLEHIDDMEKALRRVIELAPNNQQAYNALGYSFVDRNIRLPEARTLIEKALALAPDDAFILDSMGWLEFRENKNEAALTHLQRAYALRADVEIAVHVGEVLWVMGDQKKAISVWKEAYSKDPNNAALKSTLERLKVNL